MLGPSLFRPRTPHVHLRMADGWRRECPCPWPTRISHKQVQEIFGGRSPPNCLGCLGLLCTMVSLTQLKLHHCTDQRQALTTRLAPFFSLFAAANGLTHQWPSRLPSIGFADTKRPHRTRSHLGTRSFEDLSCEWCKLHGSSVTPLNQLIETGYQGYLVKGSLTTCS